MVERGRKYGPVDCEDGAGVPVGTVAEVRPVIRTGPIRPEVDRVVATRTATARSVPVTTVSGVPDSLVKDGLTSYFEPATIPA
jgi:hypothetical protein